MTAWNRTAAAGILALLLAPAAGRTAEAPKGKYGFGVSLTAARLSDETFSGTVGTSDVYDDKALIPDLHFKFRGWNWSDVELAPVVGFTTASFSGRSFTDGLGVTVSPDSLKASALYGGLRLGVSPETWNGWGIGVELDLGVSSLSDVDGTVSTVGASEQFYDGGTGAYAAFGLFGSYTFGLGDGDGQAYAGIRSRAFGTLEGQTTPRAGLVVEDLDLLAAGWEFGFAYRW